MSRVGGGRAPRRRVRRPGASDHPGVAAAVDALFGRVSRETIYYRYFSLRPVVPHEEFDALVQAERIRGGGAS